MTKRLCDPLNCLHRISPYGKSYFATGNDCLVCGITEHAAARLDKAKARAVWTTWRRGMQRTDERYYASPHSLVRAQRELARAYRFAIASRASRKPTK